MMRKRAGRPVAKATAVAAMIPARGPGSPANAVDAAVAVPTFVGRGRVMMRFSVPQIHATWQSRSLGWPRFRERSSVR
jgi:hypothetical protein